ncbi:Sulphatase-modifying factor domain protein, partial [Candidatus Magnetobacterium bavaricum]
YYSGHTERSPIYTGKGSSRVARGGSWLNFPQLVRCANRYDYTPGGRGINLGFRLVLSK